MTDSNRPPAFKIPSAKTEPLFLFFGKGDYVVAHSANEAACLWMEHFDDLGYAQEFQQLPNDELIDIYLDSDDTACSLTPMTLADLDSERARGQTPEIDTWSAAELVERFGLGYLASTEE
ncbi:MAG TPA: hypothetical protein VK571_06420 [Gemmatimonadaceae bacterium]|nr:hypothetical protein [Gemmatimonadaceae bacterium]